MSNLDRSQYSDILNNEEEFMEYFCLEENADLNNFKIKELRDIRSSITFKIKQKLKKVMTGSIMISDANAQKIMNKYQYLNGNIYEEIEDLKYYMSEKDVIDSVNEKYDKSLRLLLAHFRNLQAILGMFPEEITDNFRLPDDPPPPPPPFQQRRPIDDPPPPPPFQQRLPNDPPPPPPPSSMALAGPEYINESDLDPKAISNDIAIMEDAIDKLLVFIHEGGTVETYVERDTKYYRFYESPGLVRNLLDRTALTLDGQNESVGSLFVQAVAVFQRYITVHQTAKNLSN